MLARNAAFLDPAVIVIIIKKGDDDVNIRSIVIIPCPNDLISIRRTVQVIIIMSVHPTGFHQKKGQQEEYMSAEMQPSPSVPDGKNMESMLGKGGKRVHIWRPEEHKYEITL